MWTVWILGWLFRLDLNQWGIIPRTWAGLVGIGLSPWIHAGLGHLLSNTIPLVVLLVLLVASRTEPWMHVIEIIVLGGALLWLFGTPGSHVGASGLIYGLIAYLIVAGFKEKQLVSLGVALLVGFMYGGSLITGVLPTQPGVSWDGHLSGAIAGVILASAFSNKAAEPQNAVE